MSDFFRIHAPPVSVRLTLRQLANLVHDAEDAGDDVQVLECWDELERRGGVTMHVFMEMYRAVWKERMQVAKLTKGDSRHAS